MISLLIGDEFLRSRQSSKVIEDLQASTEGEIAIQKFNLSEDEFKGVLESVRTLPFLVEKQIFVVRRAELLKEADLDHLEAYAKTPHPQSVLILEADKIRAKSRIEKIVSASGTVRRFESREAKSEGMRLLREKLKTFKKKMTPGAESRVLMMCGESVIFLDSMLDRLIQYVGSRESIDEKIVDLFQEDWKESNIFNFLDDITKGEKVRALEFLKTYAADHPYEMVSLVGMMHWHLRRLWQAKIFLMAGMGDQVISKRLGIWKNTREFLEGAKKMPLSSIEKAIDMLFDIDVGMKQGRIFSDAGLEKWILELMNARV